MHGSTLPAGLQESDRLPEAVFTPSTKATEGHDVNISYEEAVDLVGSDLASRAREICSLPTPRAHGSLLSAASSSLTPSSSSA